MHLPKAEDALHLTWMYRLLSAIADNVYLCSTLKFKGGTCAAMQGWLDRFSIDLDFELESPASITKVQQHLEELFRAKEVTIHDKSNKVPQYFLKYPNKEGKRNTLKIDVTCPALQQNEYEKYLFPDIDRFLVCQSLPTMVAHKMYCIQARYKKTGSIAGRDIYDLHYFLKNNTSYHQHIIEKATGKDIRSFITGLIGFLQKYLTQTIIDQDLNTLLPQERFQNIRNILKQESLMLLKIELHKWESNKEKKSCS